MSAATFFCGAPDCRAKVRSGGALTRHQDGCGKWLEFQRQQISMRQERQENNQGRNARGGMSKRKGPPATLQQRKRRALSVRGLVLYPVND